LDMLDRLIAHHVKLKKVRAIEKPNEPNDGGQPSPPVGKQKATSGKQSADAGSPTQPQSGKRGRKVKNDVSEITEDCFKLWHDSLFKYQVVMRDNLHQRIRNILKSRQIGATYYFAGEALEQAILTGDNQIFL